MPCVQEGVDCMEASLEGGDGKLEREGATGRHTKTIETGISCIEDNHIHLTERWRGDGREKGESLSLGASIERNGRIYG